MKQLIALVSAGIAIATPAMAQDADEPPANPQAEVSTDSQVESDAARKIETDIGSQIVTPPEIQEQLKLTPHPLEDCKGKKRKLACDPMRTKGGFIVNTNMRDSRRTIQYQISSFSSVRENPHFKNGFEDRVRQHLREAVPIAAEIMGWDLEAAETISMMEDAYAALDRMVISLEPLEAGPDADFLARTGLSREHFSAGSFYSNRDNLMNSYSLYLWKPGFTKKRP